jgi:hypothetical protein
LDEETLETKQTVVEFVAKAASATGRDQLTKESEARLAKLSQQLDAEYHKNVPPFPPTS